MAQKKTQKQKIIEEFTKIEGIGKAKAKILYEGGFKTLDKLKSATITELKKVNGIGEAYAKKIYNICGANHKLTPYIIKKM